MQITSIVKYLLGKIKGVNNKPLFILGHEKSGTSIISFLLAKATKQSLALDIPILWEPNQTKIHKDIAELERIISKNKFVFSKEIIKEPVLSFEVDKLQHLFPDAKFVFIIRHPFEVIRSCLNRLNLVGDIKVYSELENAKTKDINWLAWDPVLKSDWLGKVSNNPVEAICHRWNYLVDSYKSNSDSIVLIKYEDFLKEKKNEIYRLAQNCNLEIKGNIDALLEQQMQSKSINSKSLFDYYGEKNFNLIKTLCSNNMSYFNYSIPDND